MMISLARCALMGGAIAGLVSTAVPATAQDVTVAGVGASPGTASAVTGQLEVTETGPLTRRIELTYTDRATGEPISQFDVELTQQLHILATDAGLTHLIHEHADEIGAGGRFIAELEFPQPGLYHIYTDAVPTGLGQQVQRFDVPVGDQTEAQTEQLQGESIVDGPLVSSDGAYTATLDAADLQPGMESTVSLLVERDGALATDLEPYLGVSAHAVFIKADDLAYVHAHAMPASDGAEGHQVHGDHGAAATDSEHQHGGDIAQHGSADEAGGNGHSEHGGAAAISPEMSLHVTAPAPGTYALWIEFIGGGEIRTVPFTIEIPEAGGHHAH